MQTPSHYTHTKIEPIKVINSINLGFNLGSAYKYLARAGHKGSYTDDLKKAIDFIGYEIEQQTFFCDADTMQIIDEVRQQEDNDYLDKFLYFIGLNYIYSNSEHLKDFKNYLQNELEKHTKLAIIPNE